MHDSRGPHGSSSRARRPAARAPAPRQFGQHGASFRIATPRRGPAEVLEQFAEDRLPVRNVVQHLADDATPATYLALLVGAQVVPPIELLLGPESGAEPRPDDVE